MTCCSNTANSAFLHSNTQSDTINNPSCCFVCCMVVFVSFATLLQHSIAETPSWELQREMMRSSVRHVDAGHVGKDSKKVKKRASWGPFSRSMRKDRAFHNGQDESFIRDGRSRSEEGSPRATLEDEEGVQAFEGMHQWEKCSMQQIRRAAIFLSACVKTA